MASASSSVYKIAPYHYIHVLDQNNNEGYRRIENNPNQQQA